MASVNDYLNLKRGDLLTITALGIIEEFNTLQVDFEVKDIRKYRHPNNTFQFTGYIIETPKNTEVQYMLMVRQVGDDFDLMMYYMDQEGSISHASEFILTPDGQDLVDRFEVDLHDKDGSSVHVVWDKKNAGTVFGVQYSDGTDHGIKTIAEYFTQNETGGIPHAILEWSGDEKTGWFELWYGMQVLTHDVTVSRINN